MNKLLCVVIAISVILCAATCIKPAHAQLGTPQVGIAAPPALKFFRVVLLPKQVFISEVIAKAAISELDRQQDSKEMFILKVVKAKGGYKVALMVRIMFFDRDQAEAALNFLKENPQFVGSKYDLEIMEDSSY